MLHDPSRDVTSTYLSTVDQWIDSSEEVLVVLRYLGMAGAKDYAFIESPVAFRQLVDSVPIGTDIIVFKEHYLPLRGEVSDDLIQAALVLVPNGSEYLCVDLVPDTNVEQRLSGRLGDTHLDLLEDLNDCKGHPVAFGPVPPFCEADNEFMISASKGGIDGPR
ncbi:MAG: hypothetical protein JWP89_5477 [Schlesneria sp.]|nr:hypothetical protein [Schlesneria sp.]